MLYVLYPKNHLFPFAACKLEMNEEVSTNLTLTSTTEDVNITVWGSPNSCTLRLLAVGGGGSE